MDDNLPLKPLQASFTETSVNDLEAELRNLFIKLYADMVQEKADTIDVFGMPHLGPLSLQQRLITDDGLTLINNGDEDRIRFLFKAWRHLNPRRGLHFLRCYLDVLWPGVNDAQQVWQKKSEPYPTFLRSVPEMALHSESEDDFFLTSRVRVDLDIGEALAENVIAALRSVLAARYVLDIRIAKFMQVTASAGVVTRGYSVARFDGEASSPELVASIEGGYASVFGATSAAILSGQEIELLKLDGSWRLDGTYTLNGLKA